VLSLTVILIQTAAPTGAESRAPAVERVHEVKRGDTLSGLARRYGTTVGALVAVNRLPDASTILRIGQRLVIPRSPLALRIRPSGGPAPRPAPLRPPANLVLSLPDFGDRLPLFMWPADGRVSSTFGLRHTGWHLGVDIKADFRAPIGASARGVIIASGVEPRYGRVVKIDHGNGFVTVYAHNDRNLVSVGDRVLSGQTIAVIGRTGRATTDHVHFEIRHDGLAYNPLYLLALPPRPVVVEESADNGHDDPEQ
jgi:murein DD-endopeptidase MepM/ murein hydrolase activator NlpD